MATQKSRHLIPTPLEIAIFLSLLVLILASLFTDKTPMQNVGYWGSGLWSLLSFMTQICLILMGGYVVAASSIVNKILKLVASLPQDRLQVYLFTFVVSTVACLLNWGFGLVVGAFFALEVSRQNRTAHFPLVVASSYIGFIFWHGGISGSIPLLVSTPKSFSRKWMGELIPFHTTVFSFFNLLLILTLFIVLCFLIFRFHRQLDKQKIISFNEEKEPQGKSNISGRRGKLHLRSGLLLDSAFDHVCLLDGLFCQ
jgi:short-chain fatty acids transporter